MRYVFRGFIPPFERVLLVESGSRSIIERLVPVLYGKIYKDMQIDLVTCYPGAPEGFTGRVYHVYDYPDGAARRKLLAQLAANQYSVTGVVCSGEPIMTKWKWLIAARVPAKVFLINQNADFLFFDWASRQQVAQLFRQRMGLSGTASIGALARLLALPFSLMFLLAYATWVHTRRWARSRAI